MNSQEFEDMFEPPAPRLATLKPLLTKKQQLRVIAAGLIVLAIICLGFYLRLKP